MTNLKGKVALVTGSARGIGKAIAERYGSLGASVVVNCSNNKIAALDTASSIERSGGAAVTIQADVSKVADIQRLFATAVEKFGRVDIAVANAGIELADHPLIAGVSEETFDRVFAITSTKSCPGILLAPVGERTGPSRCDRQLYPSDGDGGCRDLRSTR